MVSTVRMTNWQDGHPLDTKVNDRPRARSRSVDLSLAATDTLGLSDRGVARKKVTPVTKPLSESDLLKLLTGGVYSERVATLVRERGINFTPTNRDLELLRRAGADNGLERAITLAHAHAPQIATSR